MARIENIDQLRMEILRLEKSTSEQEIRLKQDLANIRQELKPINLVLNSLSSITGIKFNKNVFLKDGILYGANLLLQRFILKTEKKAEETVYKFVDVVFEKIQGFMKRHSHSDGEEDPKKE
jgi:hypothetical protein